MKKYLILLLFIAFFKSNYAQVRGLILDKETKRPIERVNVYTKCNNKIQATTSDTNGKFVLESLCDSLTFTHIDYIKKVISKSDMIDTVFLTPNYQTVGEVVVSGKQPEWIQIKLNKFISQCKRKYMSANKTFKYRYNTSTLQDSIGYAFKSAGLLNFSTKSGRRYNLHAEDNTVYYNGKSDSVDFAGLKRLLYENFIIRFNKTFVKEHHFYKNVAYHSDSPNILQLTFSSRKNNKDYGYLVIDTAKCEVLEGERHADTETNNKELTSAFLRIMASSFGAGYKEWTTDYHIKFKQVDGVYYPELCKYKVYILLYDKRNKNPYDFTSAESVLNVDDKEDSNGKNFVFIPPIRYIVFMYTKKMWKEDKALNYVHAKRDCFK